ncbi:DUF4442 domain-containing protein [Nocardia seriolae]|nr:DUF4442 domain-containing protein [Nocardia seriolae]MTJ76185.1 DUF4442 domain-containing protein [Nocardia seriolae]MTK50259.1 DUF4442 domain-containing protein [Nocardia seriolae]MTL15229.1 DUF4442 domain-containing protein [Nocardia seriolae]RLP25103.1 DUF4442 domain-containing protein [Nocardia seriolae]
MPITPSGPALDDAAPAIRLMISRAMRTKGIARMPAHIEGDRHFAKAAARLSRPVRVALRVRFWNRNHNGAACGGTLFSMTDPFFGLMAQGQLGNEYRVWNTTAGIEFLTPGRGILTTTMELPRAQADEIRETTSTGAKSITTHTATIHDSDGQLVARATQNLYVRKTRTDANTRATAR